MKIKIFDYIIIIIMSLHIDWSDYVLLSFIMIVPFLLMWIMYKAVVQKTDKEELFARKKHQEQSSSSYSKYDYGYGY